MTNAQFYIALALPTISFVLVFLVTALQNRASFEALGKRIDELKSDVGHRLDRIEAKLDKIDTEIRINHDHRLAVLEAHFFGEVKG